MESVLLHCRLSNNERHLSDILSPRSPCFSAEAMQAVYPDIRGLSAFCSSNGCDLEFSRHLAVPPCARAGKKHDHAPRQKNLTKPGEPTSAREPHDRRPSKAGGDGR